MQRSYKSLMTKTFLSLRSVGRATAESDATSPKFGWVDWARDVAKVCLMWQSSVREEKTGGGSFKEEERPKKKGKKLAHLLFNVTNEAIEWRASCRGRASAGAASATTASPIEFHAFEIDLGRGCTPFAQPWLSASLKHLETKWKMNTLYTSPFHLAVTSNQTTTTTKK